MKSQITSVAAAVLLLSMPELTEGRKQLVDFNEERVRSRQGTEKLAPAPKVGDSETCPDYCLFGNNTEAKVYWCFVFKEPLVTLGWEYNQDANTSVDSTPLKHLRWDLIYYLKNELQIMSVMDIYRLYFNESIFEVPRIDLKLDIGMIVNENGQYCPHLAYNHSAIGINSTYRQEFMNCSKVIMRNPWDYEHVWFGKYALWFEDCERSQAGSATSDDPQVTATFWQKEFWEAVSEMLLFGTLDPASANQCIDLPLVSSSAFNGDRDLISPESQMATMAFRTFFDYFYSFNASKKTYTGEYSLF